MSETRPNHGSAPDLAVGRKHTTSLGVVECGDHAGYIAGQMLSGKADLVENRLAFGVVKEPLWDADVVHWHRQAGITHRLCECRPDTSDPAVVLDGDDQPVPAGEFDQRRIKRFHPAGIDDGHA